MLKLNQKKFINIFIAILILMCILPPSSIIAQEQIELKSDSALLVDASSGKILFEKNANQKLFPASITKIMTALLVMESIDKGEISLDEKVTISDNAWKMGGSQVFLGVGEEQTVENLLKSIIISSANDACVALAEHLMGNESNFVKRMNERAKELGMQNTNFINSHGLHDDNHYTTANDIAIMTRELLKHEKILEWSTIMLDYLEHTDKDRPATMLANTNKLIRWYDGADGLKTGSHSKAKNCISATAKRNNLRLIAVILGAPDSNTRFIEAAKLLDYGFENYDSVPIIEQGEIVDVLTVEKGKEPSVNLIAERNLTILIEKGKKDDIKKEIQILPKISAPVKKGQELGKIIIYDKDDNKIEEVNLIAEKDIDKANIFFITKKLFLNLIKYLN